MTSDGPEGGTDDGPVAQEALRLAEAVSSWAKSSTRARRDEDAPDDTDDSRPQGCSCGESSAVSTVCGVCPVCRVAGIVAAIQPEVIERVADVLTMVAGSLQEVADDRRRQRDRPRQQEESPVQEPHGDGPADD